MGQTLQRTDISVLRSNSGKLYKLVKLFLVYAMGILHSLNLHGSLLLK